VSDDEKKVVTLQELRMRRASRKYEEAGLNTFAQAERVRFESGDKPSDVVQKLIDMYWRVQLASGVSPEGEDYVVTPIEQVIQNLYNLKEIYHYAEAYAAMGQEAPTSIDLADFQASVKHPIQEGDFTPPPRAFPKLIVVPNCGKCPMEYEGHCAHPKVDYAEHSERLRDCDDYYDKPHPRCPLKSNPVFLRT